MKITLHKFLDFCFLFLYKIIPIRNKNRDKTNMAYNSATTVVLVFFFSLVAIQFCNAQFHPECGQSPVQKYREIAKSQGIFKQ